jgi:hypothetical protein
MQNAASRDGMPERGLLVALDTTFNRKDQTVIGGTHLPELEQHLRRWTLLWDKVAIARNGNIMGRGHHDVDYLVSTGFAQEIWVQHDGGKMADTTHDVNLGAIYHLEESDPGNWAVDLSPGSLHCPQHGFFPANHLLERRGVMVELTNAVPVPNRDIPLAEILEFKAKRHSELLRLRSEIDDLYQRVGQSEDQAHAISSGIDSLSSSINDTIKVIREKGMPFRMTTELASVNIVGAIAAAAPQVLAQAPLLTVLANAAAGAVCVGMGFEWVRRKTAGSPYQYVALYHEQLFYE